MDKDVISRLKNINVEIVKKLFVFCKNNEALDTPSPLQARVLKYLVENNQEEINQKDLEIALNVSKATISDTLQTMEKNSLIVRETSKEDARYKKIVLTPKSKTVHKEMENVFEKLNEKITRNITQEELCVFLNVLDKLENNIKET